MEDMGKSCMFCRATMHSHASRCPACGEIVEIVSPAEANTAPPQQAEVEPNALEAAKRRILNVCGVAVLFLLSFIVVTFALRRQQVPPVPVMPGSMAAQAMPSASSTPPGAPLRPFRTPPLLDRVTGQGKAMSGTYVDVTDWFAYTFNRDGTFVEASRDFPGIPLPGVYEIDGDTLYLGSSDLATGTPPLFGAPNSRFTIARLSGNRITFLIGSLPFNRK